MVHIRSLGQKMISSFYFVNLGSATDITVPLHRFGACFYIMPMCMRSCVMQFAVGIGASYVIGLDICSIFDL